VTLLATTPLATASLHINASSLALSVVEATRSLVVCTKSVPFPKKHLIVPGCFPMHTAAHSCSPAPRPYVFSSKPRSWLSCTDAKDRLVLQYRHVHRCQGHVYVRFSHKANDVARAIAVGKLLNRCNCQHCSALAGSLGTGVCCAAAGLPSNGPHLSR
jgi:hypothetical protein